jgi:uncharacterized protein
LPLYYADASALVKLVREEPESEALRSFVVDADLVASELVLVEVPRAIRRAAVHEPRLDVDALAARAIETLEALALVALERHLLVAAGALDEPGLRTLDAIHVVAAVHVSPLDGFVTYDRRQAAAAGLAGLGAVAPGA